MMGTATETMNIEAKGARGLEIANWSKTFTCKPDLYFIPKNLDELREIIFLAKSNNKKVRVIGCAHSPSDLPLTSDYLVSLRFFNNVLSVNVTNHQVKVEAGITLAELNAHLDKNGLALSVLGSISDVTIGGAISVGTHGSGIKYGTISSYIVELELLTSSGDIIKCSKSEKSDIFAAACVSLGALGIIINVTLQCESAYLLEQHSYAGRLEEVLEDLNDHLEISDHFRFLWFPHSSNVSLCHVNRIHHKPITSYNMFQSTLNWIVDYGIGYYTLEFAYWLGTFYPPLVKYINRAAFFLLYARARDRIDVSHKIFAFECLFKQYVNEWSIPKEKCPVVLHELKRWIEGTKGMYVHFPVEVRFVKGDDMYLSPAFGRDSCYINIIMYRPYGKEVQYESYWREYERIMKDAGGRPHWAKAHHETAIDFIKMYPYFRAWTLLRKRLDPINMFMNPYMDRIFSTLQQ